MPFAATPCCSSTIVATPCKPRFPAFRVRPLPVFAQRHGTSRLPLSEDGQRPSKKKFKDYPIGYLPVDFAEVRTEEGKQYLFVAIDRTSKVAFAERHPRAKRVVAAEFLRRVLDGSLHKAPLGGEINSPPYGPRQRWRQVQSAD